MSHANHKPHSGKSDWSIVYIWLYNFKWKKDQESVDVSNEIPSNNIDGFRTAHIRARPQNREQHVFSSEEARPT